MHMIVRVEYAERWEGSDDWMGDSKRVLVEGDDAQAAVDKVRNEIIGKSYTITEGGDGKKLKKPYKVKADGFRLSGVTIIAETDEE